MYYHVAIEAVYRETVEQYETSGYVTGHGIILPALVCCQRGAVVMLTIGKCQYDMKLVAMYTMETFKPSYV